MNNANNSKCHHISQVNENIKGNTKGCEECEKIGSDWVHLRLCLSCGHVGCCDSSINKHGTKHYQETDHPVINPMNLVKIGNGVMKIISLLNEIEVNSIGKSISNLIKIMIRR